MALFLGLDTSAYTTSLALVDSQKRVVSDQRIPLQVKPGERGLRQSQALFFHLKNLPILFESLDYEQYQQVKAIAASAWPRRVENSYMPVFLAGLNQARALSRFSALPLYQVSHQEGHIMAALIGNEELFGQDGFLAVHFSGGTSEILRVSWDPKHLLAIQTGLSGLDLCAGQVVDRVGVLMGLPFPAGPALESLAMQSSQIDIPHLSTTVKGKGFSFSGIEAQAMRLIKAGCKHQDMAYALFKAIARTLEKALLFETAQSGLAHVLLAGGVMANQIIKNHLLDRLADSSHGLHLHFAEPRLCSDNAVGVACLAAGLIEGPRGSVGY